MSKLESFKDKIFQANSQNFDQLALDLFQFQATENDVYYHFLQLIGKEFSTITKPCDIPFLPIEFFKSHEVATGSFSEDAIFYSSGTTGETNARHFVKDLSIYDKSLFQGFRQFYGDPSEFAILALLPSYLENPSASLIYMVKKLIEESSFEESGFFLHDLQKLRDKLEKLRSDNIPTILIGVSFALLDMAEQYPMDLSHVIIMETGGMKGRREEMIREELHAKLKAAFNVEQIHSEYGMTELLSQCYAKKEGIFHSPPWLEVLIRDPYDPFDVSSTGKGALNIIDLANIYSSAFIATQDLGEKYEDGSFSVLGRFDHSDVRGCNLMVM